MADDSTKRCTHCRACFSLDDFLNDCTLEPVGMCMDDEFPDLNSYYFTHHAAGCGTTFGIEVERFEKFITEPIPSEIKAGGAGCHGHCTSINDLEECHNECRYAPYRRLLLRMLEKLKTGARSGDGAR